MSQIDDMLENKMSNALEKDSFAVSFIHNILWDIQIQNLVSTEIVYISWVYQPIFIMGLDVGEINFIILVGDVCFTNMFDAFREAGILYW